MSINVNRVIETDRLKSCLHQTVGKAYFDSTSEVKNSCKGQSMEYSSAIPSHPSSGNSEEPLLCDVPTVLPSDTLNLEKSNEDATGTPKEGILTRAEKSRTYISLNSLHIRNFTSHHRLYWHEHTQNHNNVLMNLKKIAT